MEPRQHASALSNSLSVRRFCSHVYLSSPVSIVNTAKKNLVSAPSTISSRVTNVEPPRVG